MPITANTTEKMPPLNTTDPRISIIPPIIKHFGPQSILATSMTSPSGMHSDPMIEMPVKHQPMAVSNSDVTGPLGNEASPSRATPLNDTGMHWNWAADNASTMAARIRPFTIRVLASCWPSCRAG